MTTRQKVVAKIKEWLGYSVSNGKYKQIIDLYNSYTPLPQGVKMQYNWAWCACTWSAAQIACGTTSVAPIEISCPRIITEAQKMGCWQENDAYSPKPGDAVLYDWQDTGVGDNLGNPDHIGMVVSNNGSTFTVVEGNMSNAVGTRTMKINGKNIRGFITPNYEKLDNVSPATSSTATTTPSTSDTPVATKTINDVAKEVIAGKWGNGSARVSALKSAGWDPTCVQKVVDELLGSKTSSSGSSETKSNSLSAKFFDKTIAGKYRVKVTLNLRAGAGTDKTIVGVLVPNEIVQCYGYYNVVDGVEWPCVKANGKDGFCSSMYLEKVG